MMGSSSSVFRWSMIRASKKKMRNALYRLLNLKMIDDPVLDY